MEKRNYWDQEFERMIVLGESTVEGGGWIGSDAERYADILAGLIDGVQSQAVIYENAGIGASVISPRSPGYEASRKPSAMERYERDVIGKQPDLFVMAYGLNDMRAGMEPDAFEEELLKLTQHVRSAVGELVIVMVTVYHMTRFDWYPPFDRGSLDITRTYNERIRRVAGKVDGLVADVFEAQGEADWLINPDGVHGNKVGNLIIANRIFETLATNCSGLSQATQERDGSTEWVEATHGVNTKTIEPIDATKK